MRDRDIYDTLREAHDREKLRHQEAERQREDNAETLARETPALIDQAQRKSSLLRNDRDRHDAEVRAEIERTDARQRSEPSADELSPSRPDVSDKLNADYERRQREKQAHDERSERRAAYMKEHHPDEYAAEELRKLRREENLRGGPVDDGVYRQDETQRQVSLQQDEAARESSGRRDDPEAARLTEEHEAGPEREVTDRQQEQTDRTREQGDAAQRRSGLDWLLAKREVERARERDGGDRDR